MEDILITDIQEFEEITDSEVIEKEVPESLEDIKEGKEIEGIEREQIDKSDTIILGSNDINNLRSVKDVDLKNYDSVLLWANDNPNSTFVGSGTLQLNDDISNYEYIKIDYYNKNNGTTDDYISLIVPQDVLTTSSVNSNYINNTVLSGVFYNSQTQWRGYLKGYNDSTKLNTFSNLGTNIVPIRIYGLNESTNVPEPTPTPNPSLPSVSGNTINNYYITVSGNGVSYNLIDKPLSEYTPTESMFALSILFALGIGFVILMRKVVFRWK